MEPNSLAVVLRSDAAAETEWWYVNGHLQTDIGEFGFHLAIFRRCTDKIRIGRFIQGKHFCKDAWFSHFSLCDLTTKTFHYAERRSKGEYSTSPPQVSVWDWNIRENDSGLSLTAYTKDYKLELELTAGKPISQNTIGNSFTKTPEVSADYTSVTRMTATGTLTHNNSKHPAEGCAWMDQETGAFKLNKHLSGWNWFAIQTKDNHELMIYMLLDGRGEICNKSIATIYKQDGEQLSTSLSSWQLTPRRFWTSTSSGIQYPVEWQIRGPDHGIDLTLTARINHAELDVRGSSCMIYWEGPASVSGTFLGQSARARAYMELVGHNTRRYMGSYNYEQENLPLVDWLYCSARYLYRRKGVSVHEAGSP